MRTDPARDAYAHHAYETNPRKEPPMRRLSLALALLLLPTGFAHADEAAKTATLYKDPQCGCCESYADYLRADGFAVTVEPTHDLSLIKRQHGVPETLAGCHTLLVDGYVVEGHVPLQSLNRLLAERPDIDGISLPGMPMGSPGMSGAKTGPFTIYELGGAEPRIYAVE